MAELYPDLLIRNRCKAPSSPKRRPLVPHSCDIKKIFTTEVLPRKYKQQKRTPLLFLTGKSPEVIFLLPWNKSMKQSSLWTIAHLLKSDAGQGGSHHRADSVCWQRMLWLEKKKRLFFETGVQASVQFGDVIHKTDWEAVCQSEQPFGCSKHFPKSTKCIQRKWNNDTIYLRGSLTFDLRMFECLRFELGCSMWTWTMKLNSSSICPMWPSSGKMWYSSKVKKNDFRKKNLYNITFSLMR